MAVNRDEIDNIGYPNGRSDKRGVERWSHKKFFIYVPKWLTDGETPNPESFTHNVSIKIRGVYNSPGAPYCLYVKTEGGRRRTESSEDIYSSKEEAMNCDRAKTHIKEYFSVVRSKAKERLGSNILMLSDAKEGIKNCNTLLKKIEGKT